MRWDWSSRSATEASLCLNIPRPRPRERDPMEWLKTKLVSSGRPTSHWRSIR
jgi:hypothetical protein